MASINQHILRANYIPGTLPIATHSVLAFLYLYLSETKSLNLTKKLMFEQHVITSMKITDDDKKKSDMLWGSIDGGLAWE